MEKARNTRPKRVQGDRTKYQEATHVKDETSKGILQSTQTCADYIPLASEPSYGDLKSMLNQSTTVHCKYPFFNQLHWNKDLILHVESTSTHLDLGFWHLILLTYIATHFTFHPLQLQLHHSSPSKTLKVYQFWNTGTIEASIGTTAVSSIAENTYFVPGAYFFAFFSWVVMHKIEFISEKCRTVRRTRTLACAYLISSVVPWLYVAVYAEAQRQNNDSKELSTAMTALMFNMIQLLRKLMGMVQLEAFVEWFEHALECLQALQGADGERTEESEGVPVST